MPSSWPITKSGCGVGPLYSRTTAIGRSPFHATPQRVRLNSRSSRSQSAYAAYSRSRSRIERSRALSVVARGDDRAATAHDHGCHQVGHLSRGAVGRSVGAAVASAGGVGSSPRSRARGSPASRPSERAPTRSRHGAPRSYGARTTPSSVTMPVMSSAGVTSKAGLRTSVPGGAMRTPRNSVTSSWRRSSIGMSGAVGRRQVDRRGRRDDVERDAVARRQHGQGVRPDLVGRVAVGRDPVRPDEDDVDLAARHQVAGGDVGDERVRDAGLGELPGRQPRSLEVRPRLVDPDVDRPLGMMRGLDDAERRPELAGGERPRVAVGEDPGPAGPRERAGPRDRTRPSGRGRSSPRRRSRPPPRASRRRSRRRRRTGRRSTRSGPSSDRPPSAG